ncbi:MAG TPA: cupredoxin domain-containing protein [Solirubrobacterales bacterium]
MITSMRRASLRILTLSIALALLAALVMQGEGAAEADAGTSAAKTVQIKGFAFKPATVKVKRGSQVAFTNSSNVAHTATGAGFDTKRIAPGKSAAVRFSRKGTFAYHCKIHSFMKGKVVVE